MTPDELAAAGRALYGECWQTSLATDLNVVDRALRRWLNGRAMPDGIQYEVRQILGKRLRQIGELLGYSLNQADRSVIHHPTNALFRYDDDGEIALIHPGVMDRNDQSIMEGARGVVREELERDRKTAERFIRASAWWLTHSSYRPVRAPKHAERLYKSHHGWAVDFGGNSFLVGKAIERCKAVLERCCAEAATGKVVCHADVEAKLKRVISGAVANSSGEEYRGYYPIRDDDLLVFGAQGIGVDDGASFMIAESSLQWDGEMLTVPAPKAPCLIENLEFNPALLLKVDELELSVRSANCLKNDGIVYLGDLVQKTQEEMLTTPNVGWKSIQEIKEVLAQMGLHLDMEIPGWRPKNIEQLAEAYAARADAVS